MLSDARKGGAALRVILWAVAALALSTLACLSIGGLRTLPVGESAPDFEWQTGERQRALSDYRGGVAIICFWSST